MYNVDMNEPGETEDMERRGGKKKDNLVSVPEK
ncbi:hypothetical protein RO3G_12428 [Rhizopus delemar RA 99-880]|uniref:Uncharacterized protein n=1 Tax=Rhizopus delemar (strain RA 99-880 / ATCC MYA-4621 / FGSC 9543 / NRRL 43880) TaxID=246409 RepID=I1CGY7_RHIO9|nr:hypothetical protein RO3G_12428 [Rhizopus delemar RA 99-880]|eukprot:EIE87717.1 hypothetical protein RO3G_12428 [Rhizopus delemar RA 99-880]